MEARTGRNNQRKLETTKKFSRCQFLVAWYTQLCSCFRIIIWLIGY